MALNRKYANLPDLDSAPDIYETPDLVDDNSTVPTTAARTQSEDEFYEVEDDADNISRSRLRIGEARSRFEPANVDSTQVDFSDRVDGKRRSYKTSSRRQRILADGTHELGDLSDDEDEESLERRIARLQREVQEAKNEYLKQKDATSSSSDNQPDPRVESLSSVLDEISKPIGVVQTSSETTPPVDVPKDSAIPQSTTGGPTYTVTYAPTYQESHALAKAADFDRRLVILERSLGLALSSANEIGENGLPRAILPTLDAMEKQMSTIAQASTANLDAISRRVRTLAQDQDRLNDTREKAKALREELGRNETPASGEESEQDTKVNALYAILPTIENLSPILPPLLDRLRSLRTIHADAATASQTLDQIEQRQADMTAELKQWNEGLTKLEAAIKAGSTTNESNLKVMEGWVKELEQKMEKLS
ncbi:Putative Dynamitin [[Torrubiella] hemipterigena]|uniref:Putative Dynamitin n=1 Tax=[Torrubiella] hemipterigena TaxID=1531966 RepID=A0A0A1SMY9_9HYPO|nr:Putative Dynamitin [[Torrubiella] hemipterigena]